MPPMIEQPPGGPALPTLADVMSVRDAVLDSALHSPLLPLRHDGSQAIHVKLENLQPIGSFKIRGAAAAISRLDDDALAHGLLTASAGNMAQGVAWIARRRGVPCTVVVPETAPATKTDAIERLGGRVIRVSFDRWWQTFTERGYPGERGAFIHPFEDRWVMAGNGTIALELLEDLPQVDTVLVPWGGGGLSCGIATVMRELRPQCRVIAVEVEGLAPLTASLAAGRPVDVDYRPTWVDGIGASTVVASMFERAQHLLAGSMTASLDEVGNAVKLLATRNRVISEGAGACPVAVALSGKVSGTVACIVSGGNIDLDRLSTLLA
ncbi:MAG: threonine ammonia-lyase [Candidatus Dormibacteria bacterium]